MISGDSSPWIKMDLSVWSNLIDPKYLISLKKDAYLFHQKEIINHIYIVKSGRLMQSAFSYGGVEKIFMFAGKGAIFGELCAFDKQPQPYGVIACTDSELYEIPVPVFLDRIKADMQLNMIVMRLLARKIKILGAQITDLAFGDTYQRVAGELLYLRDLYGITCEDGILIDLPLTQQDLANKVKASRETISKVIKRMVNAGIIEKRKSRYFIKDIRALQEIFAILQ
jgi:CRP/FNR family cyclic AMP-dependent transcriptional regulator